MPQAAKKDFTSSWWFTIWRFVRAVLVVFLMVILMLSYFEESLIFPAPPAHEGNWEVTVLGGEDVFFETNDGVKLHGWYFEHPEPKAILMFAHGNGAHLGFLGEYLQALRDDYQCTVFAFDYRGYGKSEGRTTGKGVLIDAHAAHAWLCERTGADPRELVLVGQSLGGAAAVELAGEYGARALVLERTFSSLPDVAAHHYWWAPVRWLMRTRLNSLERIKHYQGPLLQIHGDADRVVPFELGKRLHDACPSGSKLFIMTPGGGHNDPLEPNYLLKLGSFLEELPPLGPEPLR